MSERRPSARGSVHAAEIGLLAFGLLAGLGLGEGLYRARLVGGLPGHFGRLAPREGPAVVFDRSPWSFDALQGFRYPPGLIYNVSTIESGRVVGCMRLSVNDRGSYGPAGRELAAASLRLVFFGDSFTASPCDGTTYPALLGELLEKRLARTVSVWNLARDGTGVLQMMDFAAATDLASADMVILAFITDDLTRARIWRSTVAAGGEERILLTTRPEARPAVREARDVAMLDRRAGYEWCAAALASGQRDNFASELEGRFERLRLENQPVRADPLTLRHAFLWSRLTSGDPFRGLESPKPPINPRIAIADFREDGQFVKACNRLAQLGPRLQLVHLPSDTEVRAGRMLLRTPQERHLFSSLETAVGKPVVPLLDYMPVHGRAVDELFLLPRDRHPSRAGLETIAQGAGAWLQGLAQIQPPQTPVASRTAAAGR